MINSKFLKDSKISLNKFKQTSKLSVLKDLKAQGSLEYLLLIVGAVLIVAIVLAIVISSSEGSSETLDETHSKYSDDFVGSEMNKLVEQSEQIN